MTVFLTQFYTSAYIYLHLEKGTSFRRSLPIYSIIGSTPPSLPREISKILTNTRQFVVNSLSNVTKPTLSNMKKTCLTYNDLLVTVYQSSMLTSILFELIYEKASRFSNWKINPRLLRQRLKIPAVIKMHESLMYI